MKQLRNTYFFVILVIIVFTAIITTSCKADEIIVTETKTITKIDTLHQYTIKHDSIYLQDSIFLERQTILDTIRETKYVYRYKYKEREGKDSVRVVNHVDTIFISEPDYKAIELTKENAKQKVELAQTKAAKWKLMFWALLTTIVFALAFYLYYKLTKK